MGIFSRMSDIINANINSLLDKAEDPEKIVRLMIQEMEDTLVEVRSATAKTLAERKERERHLEVLSRETASWEDKATLALGREREDLARAALAEKARVADQKESIERELGLIGEQLERLNGDIGKLQAKLDDARARQRSIILRAKNAETTHRARTQIHSAKIDDVLARFEYAERRIDHVEAQSEALAMGRAKSLQEEFAALEANDRVDAELAALKRKLSGDRRQEEESQG
ncbi:MAG: phage shock protein PspA [Xanthomonadales bacterium]|nr:phage shock protein PspA [Xanthomonadales bacterium]